MTAFPRTILPVEVTELAMPGPLISKAQSGRVNIRSTQQIGRTWSERYLLKVTNTVDRGFLATVRNLWRNGTIFDIGHVDYATPKGAGGGTPLVNSASQLITNTENFGAWTASGTPILTSGQSDPLGGTAAYKLEDDNAAAEEGILQTVGFTGDGEKALSIGLKGGTATRTHIGVWDATASIWRHRASTVWTAGVPSAMTSDAGAGSKYILSDWSAPWYRFAISATGVVAANTNQFFMRADTIAVVGTWFAFGANAWNTPYPLQYRNTTGTPTQTGNLLVIDGAPASTANWLRAGDIFRVAGLAPVYEATADVTTLAGGHAQVPINPPIFTGGAPADNAALTITGVTMTACIIAPPEFPRSTGQGADYGELTLQFSEVL